MLQEKSERRALSECTALLSQVFSLELLSKNTVRVSWDSKSRSPGCRSLVGQLLIFNQHLTLTLEDDDKELELFLPKV